LFFGTSSQQGQVSDGLSNNVFYSGHYVGSTSSPSKEVAKSNDGRGPVTAGNNSGNTAGTNQVAGAGQGGPGMMGGGAGLMGGGPGMMGGPGMGMMGGGMMQKMGPAPPDNRPNDVTIRGRMGWGKASEKEDGGSPGRTSPPGEPGKGNE